jgi:hypothetical protein
LSYSGAPADNDRDAVRLYIGDTNEADEDLGDAEIEWALEQEGSVLQAAISCATALVARHSNVDSYRIGNVQVQEGFKAEKYQALVDRRRLKLTTDGVTAVAGGISAEDKAEVEADGDRVAPHFEVGLFENV